MDEKEKLLQDLTKEHENDFQSTETGSDDKGSTGGGDNDTDHSKDAPDGDDDSTPDDESKLPDTKDATDEEESGADETESAESDDSDESGTEPVGEKKDANSRIRQLIEQNKALEESKRQFEQQLSDREEAERKEARLVEDPVYTVDDFIGTIDENGDPLTDGEATARFRAWESDYKLRQYQDQQVMREQQDTLIKMQSETKEAFTKFPEFNKHSDEYDPGLAEIASEAFRAGLMYSPGHDGTKEGDDRFIVGSRINPGKLLEKLHNLRAKAEVTKVNNLGDDNGSMVGSRQVNKKANTYAPGFRGEVDKELDKLVKAHK